MSGWFRALLLVLMFAVLPQTVWAEEPVETIEWYMIDLPPIQNATGDLRGRGYTDLVRWRLIAHMPQYRHVLRNSNVHRMLADIAVKPNICNTAFLKTDERKNFMVYADPLHAQFPNGVAVLRERLHGEFARFVGEDGTLAVRGLVEEAQGVIAVQSGRSYGAVLDPIIAEAEKRNQLFVLTSNRPVDAQLGLLRARRVDLALMYPYEFNFYLSAQGNRQVHEFMPAQTSVAEAQARYTLNHLACSRSPLGEAVIAASNPIIAAQREGYFAAAYRSWLPPEILDAHSTFHRHAFGVDVRPASAELPVGDEAIANCMLDGGTWYQQSCTATTR